MINKSLIKSLLPGLLPLFVFIIADEIWGTEIGLYVAIGFGIVELIFTYFRSKKIDKFIVTDTLFLVALGGISILLDNDIFFKLKPAIIEMILAALLAISVFSPQNLVLKMSERYMKNVEFNTAQVQKMNKSLKALLYITIAHIILIVISAYYMSKEAWAFISGGLFYIIFAAYFGIEFLKTKRNQTKLSSEEYLPYIDESGKVLAAYPRSTFHNNKKYLHPVVHMHVFNDKNELFLQKRPLHKLVQPGKWDTAVGGHVSINEPIDLALEREALEEIGLKNIKPELIGKYIWETDIEKELVFMFIYITNDKLSISKEEVDDGKFWSKKEIDKKLDKEIFTPNFEHEYKILKQNWE